MMRKIEALKGDITLAEADAVINPANSSGYMGGGVAYHIKKAGGKTIEEEAVSKAPIPVGSAVLTTGGRLKAKHVIHAPTMRLPAMRIKAENARLATAAALSLAREKGFRKIAFPGMGTGVGGLDLEEAAEAMISEMEKTQKSFEKIMITDMNSDFIRACEKLI